MRFNPNLFSGVGRTDPRDPVFKTEQEHKKYWIDKILNKYKDTRPDIYNNYFKFMDIGDVPQAEAMIAVLGGIPKWEPVAQPPTQPVGPSRILDIDFNPSVPHGYRYNVGNGLPAIGSITNRRKRRRF